MSRCSTTAHTYLMGFYIMVWSEAMQGTAVSQGHVQTQAPYAMLVLPPSPSPLALSCTAQVRYFGKKDIILEKNISLFWEKKIHTPTTKKTHQNKTKNHCFGGGVGKVPFYNCQEGQNFQSLILQSILKISL